MTKSLARAAKEERARRALQRSFSTYKRYLYRRYQAAAHLDALDNLLMQVSAYAETRGQSGVGRAIIEMPPRHGKTLTVSRLYPTWHLGRNPDQRIILVSYGATLAEKNSRAARNLIRSPWYRAIFPGLELAKDSAAVNAWDFEEHEGGVDALGIGGGAAGKGAHILIIDDAFKSRAEAESELIRDKVWDSYTDDLYTRLEPGGAVVVMMTRWHTDDLIGRLLKREPDKWTRLRLPAIAEQDDALGRQVGEALWPWRYPLPVLHDIQTTLGQYSWSAEYQQEPVSSEGGIFKRHWFATVPYSPQVTRAARYWDLAMSEKTSADYTVGVKLAQCEDGHYYLLDVVRRQIDWGDLTEWMADVILADGPECAQGVEQKGYMSRAIQNLNADPRLRSYQVWGYPVDTDKLTRALPFAAKCAAGLVHVVDGYWTADYLDELCSFPLGAHDDQVDASSGAWAMMDEGAAIGFGSMTYAEQYQITSNY